MTSSDSKASNGHDTHTVVMTPPNALTESAASAFKNTVEVYEE